MEADCFVFLKGIQLIAIQEKYLEVTHLWQKFYPERMVAKKFSLVEINTFKDEKIQLLSRIGRWWNICGNTKNVLTYNIYVHYPDKNKFQSFSSIFFFFFTDQLHLKVTPLTHSKLAIRHISFPFSAINILTDGRLSEYNFWALNVSVS